MALDRISEEISHFVGLFHLETEAAKLRLDYQAFRLKQDGPGLDPLKEDPFSGRSELSLRDYNPRLKQPDAKPAPASPTPPAVAAQQPDDMRTDPAIMQVDLTDPDSPAGPMTKISMDAPSFEIMPNSIVISISQTAFLDDNDLLIFDGSADFVDPALFLTLLMDLGTLAQSLSLINPWIWSPVDGPAFDAALQLMQSLDGIEAPQIDGLETAILRGDEAEGIFIDGEKVDEAPVLKDLLPAFLQSEEADEAELAAAEMPSDGVTDYDPGPFAVDPGHNVVTGGNRVINETVLKSVWVDAPVIAVGQNVLRLDTIQQINLRVEAANLPDQGTPAPSTSMNIAHLEQTFAMIEDDDKTDGPDHYDGMPSFWNVTRLEGDLMLMNWVQQHIFVTDYDRIEVKFTGAATYMGTGENLVFNETLILNLGFHYDLIIIGGNMITVNQISQINVLLDQDKIAGEVPAGATLHAGDNLQVNSASILTTGVDSEIATTPHFAQALADLKAGAKTLSADVAKDALFAGKEMLSVLYIEGDMIQTNVIEQISYLGDSDQIHFIQDMFSTAAGADVTVTSGSNAQINSAAIVVQGLDSQVMAGGGTYSDALIYQANLIDDTANPTGVKIEALANEAVAFLVDDMIDPKTVDDCTPDSTVHDSVGSVDVMQTMLA
jgi:hypothetical protein